MYSVLSVTAAAAVSNLTTLAQLKADLQLDDTQDDFLTRVIEVCSDEISVYLGQSPGDDGNISLGRETVQEIFYDPQGEAELVLGRRPVGDVTSINEGGVTTARLLSNTDGAITSGETTFTSAGGPGGNPFTESFVGQTITIAGAGASGATLTTTIASFTSATEVELAAAAGTTVSGSASWSVGNPAFAKYIVRKPHGMITLRAGGAPARWMTQYVTVVYTAGWLMPGETGRTLPKGIEDACIIYCRTKIDQLQEGEDFSGALTQASVDGVGSFQFAGPEVRKGYGLPFEVRALLDKYLEPAFA